MQFCRLFKFSRDKFFAIVDEKYIRTNSKILYQAQTKNITINFVNIINFY